jgi:hypothetical protein
MTAFFVPGTPQGDRADRAYDDLRDRAELEAGRAPRSVRIYKLSCRRGGADCETCVGEDDLGGETVHAIFDFGDHYAICLPGGHEIVTKRQTYAIVAFDA